MAKNTQAGDERNVKAVYYKDFKAQTAVKTTKGKHPESMVSNCQRHMRANDYGAVLAEVYDDKGTLFGVIKRNIAGNEIHSLYEYDFEGDK